MARQRKNAKPQPQADAYRHPESESLMRPEVGTQAQFRKKKPPQTYRYDSSLSPALDWDGQNSAREQCESQLAAVSEQIRALRKTLSGAGDKPLTAEQRKEVERSLAAAEVAAAKLKALSKPFLNWAGKAESLSPSQNGEAIQFEQFFPDL